MPFTLFFAQRDHHSVCAPVASAIAWKVPPGRKPRWTWRSLPLFPFFQKSQPWIIWGPVLKNSCFIYYIVQIYSYLLRGRLIPVTPLWLQIGINSNVFACHSITFQRLHPLQILNLWWNVLDTDFKMCKCLSELRRLRRGMISSVCTFWFVMHRDKIRGFQDMMTWNLGEKSHARNWGFWSCWHRVLFWSSQSGWNQLIRDTI